MISLSTDPAPAPHLVVRRLGRVQYGDALALQESLLAQKIAGADADDLLLLEHEPVYTLGRGADGRDLGDAPGRFDVPVFRIGRGGGATFHGPGQLVAYPIVRLIHRGRDVLRYVRMLEQTLIATCARWGIVALARPGATGVWVANEKIASIGIGVRRSVTYHGVALNVATDLAYFAPIVTCREANLRMTSMHRLLPNTPSVGSVGDAFADCFADVFGYRTVHCDAA